MRLWGPLCCYAPVSASWTYYPHVISQVEGGSSMSLIRIFEHRNHKWTVILHILGTIDAAMRELLFIFCQVASSDLVPNHWGVSQADFSFTLRGKENALANMYCHISTGGWGTLGMPGCTIKWAVSIILKPRQEHPLGPWLSEQAQKLAGLKWLKITSRQIESLPSLISQKLCQTAWHCWGSGDLSELTSK